MSPRQIAEQFKRFIDGGPHEPRAPWVELVRLYRRGMDACAALQRAMSNSRDRATFELARVAAQRAYHDLRVAHRPFERLDEWQRAYIDAQISMPRNAARRVAAIAKLRDSLSDFAREQYAWRGYPQAALDAMVVVILGDAEQRQRLQWEPSGVPARRYGIGKRLRRWFGSRSTKLTEDEVASDLPRPFLRDEDALGAMATTDDVEGGALFRALGVNLLTQAQQAVVRLRAAGWDDAEIAKCLGIEPVTVRIHARDAAKRLARFLNEPTHRPSGKH